MVLLLMIDILSIESNYRLFAYYYPIYDNKIHDVYVYHDRDRHDHDRHHHRCPVVVDLNHIATSFVV